MSSDKKDALGNRIKNYESCSSTHLIPGTPKIIRHDGKAFHSFLKNCEKPYDKSVMHAMADGAIAVMKEIGGSARFAYIQSDESSIVINDKPRLESSPWFDNKVQKIVSVSASIMSVNFSQSFHNSRPLVEVTSGAPEAYTGEPISRSSPFKPAYFDARVFEVPNIYEMHNAILWRQFDAIKNSISQYARHYFSQKQVHGITGHQKIEMMKDKHNFDWNSAPTWTKRGIIISRGSMGKFEINYDIPVFTLEKDFLINLYNVPEETQSA